MAESFKPLTHDLAVNALYCGDNLKVMASLPEESFDLIYADPPFFSSRNYELLWGDSAERRAFDDRWKGGLNVYLDWMEPRLRQMYRLLTPAGTFCLHCDWHAVHYLKVMLDSAYGYNQFRNHIVWRRMTSSGFKGKVSLGRNHDAILVYAKGPTSTYHPEVVPYHDEYKRAKFAKVDEHGKRFKDEKIGTATSPERIEELKREGRIYVTRTGKLRIKHYLESATGFPLDDVWTDIPPINSQSRERLGFPTQKPEKLLSRVLSMFCDPGNLVGDFFCGCGTTMAAAQQLERKWVGCDVSPTALKVVRERLLKLGASTVPIVGMPTTLAELRDMDPFEFQNHVIGMLLGTHSPTKSVDHGIDGYTAFKKTPVQVKQSEKVGSPIVQQFRGSLRKSKRGVLVALSFTRPAREEVGRLHQDEDIEIILLTPDEIQREDFDATGL